MEKITFKSPEQIKEEDKKERLLKEGGIYYDRVADQENGSERSIVNILGVELETQASEEDIAQLKEEIILSNLDQTLLRKIAECYKLKQPILFEGDPGAGKTFLYEKFIEMLYGKNCPIDTLVGSPRTSELDILGHWAPKGEKKIDPEKYNDEIIAYEKSIEFKTLTGEFNNKLSNLNQQLVDNRINEEEFEKIFSEISIDFTQKQKDSIVNHFSKSSLSVNDSDWEFKQGALLRAYAGREGKGYPLIVDEFNIIPSNYQQIFLQIGGQGGGLSEKVSFWGNGGKTSYHRGKETAIFFASNFPEKTEGRSEVVAPMSDRLVWTILSDKEYQEKKKAIKQTAGGRLQNRKSEIFSIDPKRVSIPVENGVQWDKVLNEKLGEQIADVVDLLDDQFVKNYSSLGDKLSIGGENRKRTQKLEFSGRNALRLFNYLDHFQVRGESGSVDFTETLRKGYEMYYVNRLADPEAQKKAWKIFDELMIGDTGKIEYDAFKLSLVEQMKVIDGGKKVNIYSRKDLMDLMTQKAEQEKNDDDNKESMGKSSAILLLEGQYTQKIYNNYKNGIFDEVPGDNEQTHKLKKDIREVLSNAFDSTEEIIITDTEHISNKYKNGGISTKRIRLIYPTHDTRKGGTASGDRMSLMNDSLSKEILNAAGNLDLERKISNIFGGKKQNNQEEALTLMASGLNQYKKEDGNFESVLLADEDLKVLKEKIDSHISELGEKIDGKQLISFVHPSKYWQAFGTKIEFTQIFAPGMDLANSLFNKDPMEKILKLLHNGHGDPVFVFSIVGGKDELVDFINRSNYSDKEIVNLIEKISSYINVKFLDLAKAGDKEYIQNAFLEATGIRSSEKLIDSEYLDKEKENKVSDLSKKEKIETIIEEPPKTVNDFLQKKYAHLLANRNFEFLRKEIHRNGITPVFRDEDVQKAYVQAAKHRLFKEFNEIEKITNIAPSEETKKYLNSIKQDLEFRSESLLDRQTKLLKGGVFGTLDEDIKLHGLATGFKNKDIQEAYLHQAESGRLDSFINIEEITNIAPSKDTMKLASELYLRSKGSTKNLEDFEKKLNIKFEFKSKSILDIAIKELDRHNGWSQDIDSFIENYFNFLNKTDIKKFYAHLEEKLRDGLKEKSRIGGFVSVIDKVFQDTGETAVMSDDLIKKVYLEMFKENLSVFSFDENLKKLHESTKVPYPTWDEEVVKNHYKKIERIFSAPEEAKKEIEKIKSITGIEPD